MAPMSAAAIDVAPLVSLSPHQNSHLGCFGHCCYGFFSSLSWEVSFLLPSFLWALSSWHKVDLPHRPRKWPRQSCRYDQAIQQSSSPRLFNFDWLTEYIGHAVLTVLLILSGYWIEFLLNIPLIIFHGLEYQALSPADSKSSGTFLTPRRSGTIFLAWRRLEWRN